MIKKTEHSKEKLFQIKAHEVDFLKFLTQLHAAVPTIFIPIVSSVGHRITEQLLIGWSVQVLLVFFGFLLIKAKIALLTLKEMTEITQKHNTEMLKILKIDGTIDSKEFERLKWLSTCLCYDLKRQYLKKEDVDYFNIKKEEFTLFLPIEGLVKNDALIAEMFYLNHSHCEWLFLGISIVPLLLYLWHAWIIAII